MPSAGAPQTKTGIRAGKVSSVLSPALGGAQIFDGFYDGPQRILVVAISLGITEMALADELRSVCSEANRNIHRGPAPWVCSLPTTHPPSQWQRFATSHLRLMG
ncbi:hypothetical protein MTO96_038335 [Rhipicephalus appendiculatus]